jgi:glucosamine-6-phosphate deaminase
VHIVITPDYHSTCKKVADLMVSRIKRNPSVTLGLPTGDTPLRFYQNLVEEYNEGNVNFSKAKIFNLDEYANLSGTHTGSYAFYMYGNLLSHVNLPKGSWNIPNGIAKNLEEECRRYEKKITLAGGLNLTLLGIGMNGHIGFNEPGTPFNSLTHISKLTKNTIDSNRHHFGSPKEMPKLALTMGVKTIMNSDEIILMASGPKKAHAIYNLVYGHLTRKFPASILQTHNNVTLVIDEAAATELKKAGYTDVKSADFTIYDEKTLPTNKNIVIISPHPDDSAIGVGGIVSMLSPHNKVTTLVMTSGHRAQIQGKTKTQRTKIRRDEAKEEADILGVDYKCLNLNFYEANKIDKSDEQKIYSTLKKLDPDIIFQVTPKDLHPTHQMSTELVTSALRKLVSEKKRVIEVWHYESPWWLFQPGDFNAFVQLSDKAVKNKVKAVEAHRSQTSRTPYDKLAEALAVVRGATVPEQVLGKYGETPPKLKLHAEVFAISRFSHDQKLVESLSGVRGIYGVDLTEEVAENYGYTYGNWLREKISSNPSVIIGMDSRPSGKSLIEAMVRGLDRAHCHINRVGVGTTPMIQFEVRNNSCDGGIIVTASHNEPDWNGFKFLWRDGGVLKPSEMEDLIERFHSEKEMEERAKLDHYIKYVNDTMDRKTLAKIRKAKLKVVVDPNGGAMIVLIKKLFAHFNIKTVDINMDLGVFRHKVEPTEDALVHIGPIIKEKGADLGVAWDCDGDRVEVILSNGKQISGHYVFALLVDEVLSEHVEGNVIVMSNATSRLVSDIAKRHGATTVETDTGEANVVKKMYEIGAPVGGEGACGGGIIPPSRCRDGVLTLMKILGLMVKRKKPLKEIVLSYPKYYTYQKNVRLDPKSFNKLMKNIKKFYKAYPMTTYKDNPGAIKINLSERSFLLFRQSKTESDMLRIISDCKNNREAQKNIDEALNLLI